MSNPHIRGSLDDVRQVMRVLEVTHAMARNGLSISIAQTAHLLFMKKQEAEALRILGPFLAGVHDSLTVLARAATFMMLLEYQAPDIVAKIKQHYATVLH